MAVYDKTLWHNAEFIYTKFPPYFDPKESFWKSEEKPAVRQHRDFEPGKGLPVFFTEFEAVNPSKGRLLLSALGCVDVWINGKRVGNDELKPGWSDYNKRVLCCEYDVGSCLVNGTNRVLAVVSNGWYAGRIAGGYYGINPPAVMLCLNYSDATGERSVVTDREWSAFVGGPILNADIWDGEYRDGRLDGFAELSRPGKKLSHTEKAKICKYFDGEVSPLIGPPVRVRNELTLRPSDITVYAAVVDNGTDYGEIARVEKPGAMPFAVKKGQTVVIDMGQESVGWAKIKLRGECGTKVRLRYGEMLNDSGDEEIRGNDGPKGSVYSANLRSAKAKGYYILAGGDAEIFRPTFTFFGYRYVEVTADADFELLDLTAEVVGSANVETGHIETSDERVNKLISNTLWGQRSNYLSVPTDCPQRDERLGWTGDAQAFCRTAAYNADVLGFLRKWLRDMRDSQGENGEFSDVVPRVGCCKSDNASAWGDAGIIIPHTLYLMYGERAVITEHYAAMEKYIANLVKINGFKGAEPRYGDWLAYDWCSNEFTSCVYFIHDLDLMAQMSEIIGRPNRVEYYTSLRRDAYAYFVKTFMKDGELVEKKQANYVLALAFDLLEGSYAKKAVKELVRLIRENGNRLSTGFHGTCNLCTVLSKCGEDGMAYTLLLQREDPSWLFSVDHGATTIWERWNSFTDEMGFGHADGMNSFNHYAYGAVVEWMYRYMAGIEAGSAGFEKILFQPRPDSREDSEIPSGQQRITRAAASYKSVHGLIESSWQLGESFIYECTVPETATATLLLPVYAEGTYINGEPHHFDEYKKDGSCAVIKLAPGKYVFEQPLSK